MFEHLDDLVSELEKLESRLSEIYAGGDQAAARDAGRRHAELKPVVDAYLEYRATEQQIVEARDLLEGETDAEMRDYLRTEVTEKEQHLGDLEERLKELLVPSDPNDGKNVILEIRGTEGGEEANLFAADLFHMYEGLAKRHGWKVEIAVEPAQRHGRVPGDHDGRQGRGRLDAPQARGRRAPRATRAGHREPGARSTPARRPCQCSPRPRRSTSRSIRTTSRSTCTARAVRVGSR